MDKLVSQICISQEPVALARVFIATQTCDRALLRRKFGMVNLTKIIMILFSQAPVLPR